MTELLNPLTQAIHARRDIGKTDDAHRQAVRDRAMAAAQEAAEPLATLIIQYRTAITEGYSFDEAGNAFLELAPAIGEAVAKKILGEGLNEGGYALTARALANYLPEKIALIAQAMALSDEDISRERVFGPYSTTEPQMEKVRQLWHESKTLGVSGVEGKVKDILVDYIENRKEDYDWKNAVQQVGLQESARRTFEKRRGL